MNLISQKPSHIILGVTALLGSKMFFALLQDPEGPNLLIVTVLAVLLYGVSGVVYRYSSAMPALWRFLVAIATQIFLVLGLFFFLV